MLTRAFLDRQSESWAYIRRSDVQNTNLAIFVHGFRGSYLTTWGQLADFLKMSADDPRHGKLNDWDYLFIGYKTRSIASYLDIANLISTQAKRALLSNPPFNGTVYSKIAFVGHSLGTLGIRQLLCATSLQPPQMWSALGAVILFGSPINGSGLAGIAGFVGYKIGDALKTDGAQLRMLHTWNETLHCPKSPWPKSIVAVTGLDDKIVGTGGLANWKGDTVLTTNLDHSGICKIEVSGHNTQSFILDILKSELP